MSSTYLTKRCWLYIWFNIIFSKNCFSVSEKRDVLVTCIEDIMEKYVNPEDLILQVNLNSSLKLPVVQYDPRKDFHMMKVRKPDVYVIYIDNNLNILKHLFNTIYVNPRAKFIIACEEITSNLLQLLNHFYVHRVVLLKVLSTDVITLYSNYAYSNNNFIIVGTCTEINNLKKDDLFQDRLPTDKNKLTVLALPYYPYVINITSTDFVGIEISLINLISSHLKINVTYINSKFRYWGDTDDENFTHALGELKNRRYDFAIGGFHLKCYEFLYFDMSVAYLRDSVKMVAPKAKLLDNNLTSFFKIFQKTVWILYLVSLLIFFVIFYVLHVCSSTTSRFLMIFENTLFLLQLIIEAGVRFNANYKFMHFFLILCIFFMFNINTTIKSQLLVFFSEKKFEHQINVIEDIMESKIKVGYHPYFNESFENYGSDAEKYIYENSIPCGIDWVCMNRTAHQRDLVTAQTEGEIRYYSPSLFVDSEGRALLHITDIVVSPVSIHVFFVKGFPLFERIDKYLTIMRESGFSEYHYNKIDFLNAIALEKATYKSRKFLEKSLNLKKLAGPFYFYFVGILLSTVTFLIELFLVFCSKL